MLFRSSTRTVLDLLTPHIPVGAVLVLDEFFIVVEEEQRAFNEWLEASGRDCRHEARSIEQLCVIMES